MATKLTAAEKRVAQMRRHDALVQAAYDAIAILEAPFSEHDEIPGTMQDAIAVLRAALKT